LAVVADLALLWILWPSISYGTNVQSAWRNVRPRTIAMMALLTAAPILLVLAISTFPGEPVHSLPSLRFIPWGQTEAADPAGSGKTRWKSLHEVLVGGDVDFVARRQTSIWSNRLVIPGIEMGAKAGDETKPSSSPEAGSFRGRNLEGAVFSGANLRRVDFRAARLAGAVFVGADLRGAQIGCMLRNPGDPFAAELKISLAPKTICAELQGAVLDEANLQGVDADGAHLQGASLIAARLQGASLNAAKLHGANFEGAQLQAASLMSAQLAFSRFTQAHLQGAVLDGATMTRSVLDGAQLHGASLVATQLHDASLFSSVVPIPRYTVVWRADPRRADLQGTFVENPETGPKEVCGTDLCNYTSRSFAQLKRTIEQSVLDERLRTAALARIEERLDPEKAFRADEEVAKAWKAMAQKFPPDPEDLKKQGRKADQVVDDWLKISCDPDGAPYVASRLLQNMKRSGSGMDRDQKRTVAARLLDTRTCPGAIGLTAGDRALLFVDPADVTY